ncbi:MAG TPA: acyltransferase [Acidimicrobiales bacterium]|nr:acyltransferase [Acidimicrobiales bacterium]
MPFTLGRRTALDGIRGLAVAAVVALHAGIGVKGGYLGVQIFFVLSGFVITAVLLEEARETGGISLRQFYLRRVLRLLPALVAVLAFVAAYSLLFPGHAPRHQVARAEAGALFYVVNWVYIHVGSKPYLLVHTWSLSIEEQFYLLWPPIVVALALRGGRYRRLAQVALVGVAASTAVRWVLIAHGARLDRVYLGTDTRVDALLMGCAVAIACYAGWMPRRRATLAALRIASFVGAAVVIAACLWWGRPGVLHYHGLGLSFIALCTAAIIAAVVVMPAGVMPRVLSWSPLTELGKISYGLYLWHLPLFVMFRNAFPHTTNWIAVPLMTVIAVGVSLVSYHYIEEPFLRMKERLRPAPVPVTAVA